jgi:hypothetical protein
MSLNQNRILKKLASKDDAADFIRSLAQMEKSRPGQAVIAELERIQDEAWAVIIEVGTEANRDEQNLARGRYGLATGLLGEGFGIVAMIQAHLPEFEAIIKANERTRRQVEQEEDFDE